MSSSACGWAACSCRRSEVVMRLGDFVAALRRQRALERGERPRPEAIVEHAAAHSPFYREHGDAPLDKATMMERFDDIVTDARLRRDELLAHVERVRGDELYLGRYRVMTTSGSSGRKGLFVYDRDEWRAIMAQFLRHTAFAGVRPRLPRLRIAAVVSPTGSHMSRRVAHNLAVGVHRTLGLPVTLPMSALVEQLNAFQPQVLAGYPSMLVLLA